MRPSLLKYLKSGWKLNCSFAIDFTESNGRVTHHNSKHRQNLKRMGDMNQYEKAIYEVGSVLQKYSTEQFTMYGFGGIPKYLGSSNKRSNKELVKCWNLAGESSKDGVNFSPENKV